MEAIVAIAAGSQAVTGIVQTNLQRRQICGVSQPTVKDIRNDLIEGVRILRAVRMDFEDEVKKNTTRVESRTYMEWKERAKKIEHDVTEKIAEYESNENGLYRLIYGDFREDMKRMLEKVKDLLQASEKIRDKMLVDRLPESIVKMEAPDIRKYETLQKPLEKILEWLKIDKVKKIGIYGIVGIGKTTIMKNLNNHDEVAKMFGIVIWLKVSKEESKENRSKEDLQDDIARRLKLTKAGTSNAEEVAQRISTKLEGKKYLLLLDDVKEDLNLPEIGIPDNNNSSKIVLTTRRRLVSNKMAVDKEIKAACLSSNEAWKMFRDVLRDDHYIKDSKISRLAQKVCRECGGLPLLIEKVASAFKLKKTETLWRDGWNCWMTWPSKECEGIREVYELLRFCYNDLEDERYQKCFLYGALYPEDSDINTYSLLACWEAEDLLQERTRGVASTNFQYSSYFSILPEFFLKLLKSGLRKLGEIRNPASATDLLVHENDVRKKRVMAGFSILNHLKNVSLIEEGKKQDHVTMNQFIRQAALYISGENYPECKLLVETSNPPNEKSWIDKNRISLGANKLDKLPDSPNCSMLSTLFLQANKCLEIIPPHFFKHMIELRVLDLSDTGIKLLPSSLQILIKLKVLHVNNCKKLLKLPSHIEGLKDLQFLDIHGSGINGIPLYIMNLKFLKYLWVSFGNGNEARGVSSYYDMISDLSALEELVIDFESLQQWTNEAEYIMKEVATLKKFKKLRVCLPEMIVDVIEIAPESVSINVPEARALLSYIQRSSWEEVRKINSFQFFVGLKNGGYCQHPKFDTYEKYVKYCNGVVSNTPILEVLEEAKAFELVDHRDIKKLSNFGTAKMDNIQGFLIDCCVEIETIIETHAVDSKLLPNLEELIIKNLPKLKSIWEEPPRSGSLTKLTTLVISNCPSLTKAFPAGVHQQLHEIQYLTIEMCNEVEEIFPQVNGVNLLELPNLKELILLGMTKLSSICAVPMRLSSLKKLKIFDCPDLHKLPFKKGDVTKLDCIEAEENWWGALQDKEELQELYMPLEI